MSEENTIVYSYNKDTKIYTINDKEMQKINRKLKERFTLKQENQQLKERVAYLERSCERKEETILNLRHEQQLDKYKEVIEKVREHVERCAFNYPPYSLNELATEELLEILDKVKEVK